MIEPAAATIAISKEILANIMLTVFVFAAEERKK